MIKKQVRLSVFSLALTMSTFSLQTKANELAIAKSLFQFNRVTEIALTEAPKGNAEAQIELYFSYGSTGIGVDIDYEIAYKWLNLAAQNNDPRAVYYLASAVKSGNISSTTDSYQSLINKSISLHFDRAKSGNTDSIIDLFYMNLNGEIKLPESSVHELDLVFTKTLTDKIRINDTDSLEKLGSYLIYTREKLTKKKSSSAQITQGTNYLLQAANQGSHWAMRSLSDIYSKSDLEKSKFYINNAASLGNTAAMDDLGRALWSGRFNNGIPNEQEAVKWFSMSAAHGSSSAQLYLGYAYWEGRGVQKDSSLALKHWIAASKHEPRANYLIGRAYIEDANGIPKNPNVGMEFMQKASSRMFPRASQYISNLYLNGDFFIENRSLARANLTSAAIRNDVKAQFSLAEKHYSGIFGPKNIKNSYFWTLIASNWKPDPRFYNFIDMKSYLSDDLQQVQLARQLKIRIEKELSNHDIDHVQQVATNWKAWQDEPAFTTTNNNRTSVDDNSSTAAPRPKISTPTHVIRPDIEITGVGSGFKVANNLTVTNNHVINGCNTVLVNGISATVIKSDKRSDLALLKTNNLPGSVAPIRRSSIRVGENVAAAGFPLRGILSGFNITQGNVSSLSGMIGNQSNIQITTPVQPGNSGGPLLDSNGDVIGVIVSKLRWQTVNIIGTLPENINFAVSLNELTRFLSSQPVTFAPTSNQQLALADIADKAKSFTTVISCR